MINREMERQRTFTRRVALVGAAQLAGFGVLAARLGYLQIIEQEKYQQLSDKNRISQKLILPARGEITDRFGVPLAINSQNFQVYLVPEQTDEPEKALRRLTGFIPLSEKEIKDAMAQMKRVRSFTPILVKENISWEEMARIELHLPELPGIFVDEGTSRYYPFGEATAHLVGYVGRVSESEITEDPVMMMPGFRIGKIGVEQHYDTTLRGTAGRLQSEVNVVGRAIRDLGKRDSIPGKRLTLTIDAELQMACQERLRREQSASAVVMDVHTGAVYALCSHPGYDPNVFSKGISADLWEELVSDPRAPLTNKVIGGQYPPGSTFKMVTALAALEAGIVTAGTRVYCPGHYMLGRDKFHCWKNGGHGSMDLVQALEQSCDTYFYEVARKTGIDRIAEMGRRLGLDVLTGIEMPHERPGLMPDTEWKRKAKPKDRKWHQGETLVAGIGQGYVLTTPMQLAVMQARLVNGGKAVLPTLVKEIGVGQDVPARTFDTIGIKPAFLNLVKLGTDAVVNGGRGTAAGSRIKPSEGADKGYSMGGKTGTAQVRRITAAMRAAGVKNEDLPWRQRHHALFVGYGPVENPRYACAVVVEHGVGGSKAAAPIAHDLILMTLQRDPVVNQGASALLPLPQDGGGD